MRTPLVVLAGALALSPFAFARVKSYDLEVTTPVMAKNVQIAAGEYKVKVEGSNAIFNDVRTGQSITVPVTVETASTKFDSTAMETNHQGNMNQLVSIDLGGSKTKLDFAR